jgi:hypothetical protein
MAGAYVVGGFVLVPLSLLVARPWEHWQTWIGWPVVLYGAVPITLRHLWLYSVVRTPGASRTVTFLSLMPFAAVGRSWALVARQSTRTAWLARRWSVTGVYLATRPT